MGFNSGFKGLNKLHNNVQVTQVNAYTNGNHLNDIVARRE